MKKVAWLLAAALCAACNASVDSPVASDVESTSLALESSDVTWGPCPDDSIYAFEPGAECATFQVPLDHARPHGETIPLFVARKLSGTPNAKQLWMLDGGPGGSGEEFFYGLLDEFAQAMPDVDIYVPAHRGTGRSAGLTCTGEGLETPRNYELTPAEWVACRNETVAKWGDKLRFFDVTQAALDLGTVIARSHAPNQDVFLYGLSYGTFWAWRYLEFFPFQATGIIQDSVVSPGEITQTAGDTYFDPVLAKYASLCKADALCNSKMGPDPVARIRAVEASLDAGHCAAAGIDRKLLRDTLGQALIAWDARLFALAVPYRLERCSAADVTALQTFVPAWWAPAELDGYSHALASNIDFSEFWEHPAPSPARVRAIADHQLASLDYAAERADIYETWPKYFAPLKHTWPLTRLPLLMLNGDLDVETPIDTARVSAAHFHGPHQSFVTLPNAPHGAGYQSPTTLPDGLPCGIKIMASFVHDPHAAPDTSCIAAMEPVVFENADFAGYFFGTASVWE